MLSGYFNLDVQELCRPCNICSISVRWFTSIKDIKDLLKLKFNAPPSRMSLFCVSNPKSLRNPTTLHDLGIEQSGHTLRIAINMTANTSFQLLLSKDIHVDNSCKEMISCVRQGFERSQIPSKTDLFDCTGGVYFLKASSGEKIAVFKPNDEEQGMPSNPKGHSGNGEEGLRPFFRPGQGYIRETAAYLMDYKNFCQVPPTTIVHCEHSCFYYPAMQNGLKQRMYLKVGSLQSFVHAGDTFEDISPSLIGTLELQKIALLDIRLLNCDRNSSNILAIRKAAPNTFHNGTRCRRDSRSSSTGSYTSDEYGMMSCEDIEFNPFQEDEVPSTTSAPVDMFELIPIDHGYCIPSRLQIDELDWIWFYCPQIAREVDPEIRRYVASLDIEQMMRDLEEQLKIDVNSCFLLRLAHCVLVTGIAAGLTLFDIAQIVARTNEDHPSPLEKVIKSAEENAHRALEMRSNRLNSRGRGEVISGPCLSFRKSHEEQPSPQHLGTPVIQQRKPSTGLSRVVQSAYNLADMDRGILTTTSPCTQRPPKFSIVGSYLSSENIDKLMLNGSHAVPKFPSEFSYQEGHVGDFYLAELSPHRLHQPNEFSTEQTFDDEGQSSLSLGLSRSLMQPGGERLKKMHSVDSSAEQFFHPFSSRTSDESATAAAFAVVSSSKRNGPYLRTGFLCESENSRYQKSPPSLMALRDRNLSGYSDATTSSETSKDGEDGFSSKSFGCLEIFSVDKQLLLAATERSTVPVEKALILPLTSIEATSLSLRNAPPVERPFPPRVAADVTQEYKKGSKGNMIDFSGECSSSEEEINTDREVNLNKEQLLRDVSITSFSSFRSGGALNNLQRVASFNAFESPTIYDENGSNRGKNCDRQLTMLHRERRKAMSLTADFHEMCLKFAYEAIGVLISKESRHRDRRHH